MAPRNSHCYHYSRLEAKVIAKHDDECFLLEIIMFLKTWRYGTRILLLLL